MTLATQAEFARRIGRDKAHVTRLKQADRLVMVETLVDVEKSLERIHATRGTRYDVEEREALARAQRAAESVSGATPTDNPTATPQAALLDLDEIGRRTRHAQMLEKEAVARIREREEQEQAGVLVRRAAVGKAAADAVGVIRNHAETLPDRLAPLITGLADPVRVKAILRDEIEQLLDATSRELTTLAGHSNPHTSESTL